MAPSKEGTFEWSIESPLGLGQDSCFFFDSQKKNKFYNRVKPWPLTITILNLFEKV
jgi:hypothetical protein